MKNYGEDLAFFEACGIEGIELCDATGQMRVLLIPAWQGRVMTSTANGREGSGFGWINDPLIASGVVRPQFNPVGGEERLWLGPEGGPFSLYFASGAEQVYENWQVPAALDTEPFEVSLRESTRVRFRRKAFLRNAAGTLLRMGITREVVLLQREETAQALGCEIAQGIRLVAYRSENRIVNRGGDTWTPLGGAPSIWMLGMFPPTPSTTVFLPCDPAAGNPIINSDYFGELPADRLVVRKGTACLRIDGKFRSKIGLPAGCDIGLCGSYDPQSETLTLIRYPRSSRRSQYVENRWGEQADPFAGDVVNAYNDGPTETDCVMGPFYEIETSSPAALLRPGEERCHTQTTFHLQGPQHLLDRIVRKLLPTDLRTIRDAFNS